MKARLSAMSSICDLSLLVRRVEEEKEGRMILRREKNPSTYAAEFCTAFLRM